MGLEGEVNFYEDVERCNPYIDQLQAQKYMQNDMEQLLIQQQV